MRGVKPEDLMAIDDFLYYGEANVYQENIDAFLAIAEELKLKGLTKGDSIDKTEEHDFLPYTLHLASNKTHSIKVKENKIPLYETVVSTEISDTAVLNFAIPSVNITDI